MFGRPPDFSPHDDFHEWRVLAGVETWWQIVGVPYDPRPLHSRVRFRVHDVHAAAEWARAELGVKPSPITTLPRVVAFTDFTDHWHNRLGYYQDITSSGDQPEPGGSVHDPSLFAQDLMG